MPEPERWQALNDALLEEAEVACSGVLWLTDGEAQRWQNEADQQLDATDSLEQAFYTMRDIGEAKALGQPPDAELDEATRLKLIAEAKLKEANSWHDQTTYKGENPEAAGTQRVLDFLWVLVWKELNRRRRRRCDDKNDRRPHTSARLG